MSAISDARADRNRAIEKALGYAEGNVIAVKIWERNDIEAVFMDDFEIEDPDEDLIPEVVRDRGISRLEECCDEEWETIRLCCADALKKRESKKKEAEHFKRLSEIENMDEKEVADMIEELEGDNDCIRFKNGSYYILYDHTFNTDDLTTVVQEFGTRSKITSSLLRLARSGRI